MKAKKTYTRPSIQKTTIDKEISMVMMSPLVGTGLSGLLKWVR